MNHYQDQRTYLGRLHRPVEVVQKPELDAWAQANPGAYVVVFNDRLPDGVHAELIAAYPYREHELHVWRVSATR